MSDFLEHLKVATKRVESWPDWKKSVLKNKQVEKDRTCLHDLCERCNGTGLDNMGRMCIHMISCPCPTCSPTC